MSRLSPFGFLFGKSLTDLVRGIRRYPDPEDRAKYIRDVVAECREEVRSANLDVKSTAILKLAYLEMLGIDMTWAGFHVVEVMASPKFQQKRVGYMAATQSFRNDSELKMLVTNLLKMDLVNQNPATVGVALSGLASIVSPLLAADVADDIMRMLSHSKPYIRKKAVLALHNVILQYPEILPQALQRFGELLDESLKNLEDSGNASVASAIVSVICELAKHSESVQDFLSLTPRLYELFEQSQNNWMLIKLLKIFELFVLREPRLKTKLLPAVRTTMNGEATSLVYETMKCVLRGGMLASDDHELAREITNQILQLLSVGDANLNYLGAGLLGDLAAINTLFLPRSAILDWLRMPQPDRATRKRLFHLAACCVGDDNFADIITELMNQFRLTKSLDRREDLAGAIADLAAKDNYAHVPDFEWFVAVLTELVKDLPHPAIAQRILDIVIRVKDEDVRKAVAKLCWEFLNTLRVDAEFSDICWWIIGEYPAIDPRDFFHLVSSNTTKVTPTVVSSIAKMVARDHTTLDEAIKVLAQISSPNFELQERACQFLELLKLAKSNDADTLITNGLSPLFVAELTPIAPGSQKRITVPENVDFTSPVDVPQYNFSQNEVGEIEPESEPEPEPEPEPAVQEPEERQAEKQLFNLSHLAGLNVRETPPPPTVKKKVVIAQDETVEGEEPKPVLTKPAKQLFQSGFRQEVYDEPLEPVKIKHKKKKKKPKVPEDAFQEEHLITTASEPT